ncbi:hypothetical protein QWY31_11500 [Cytophagales bacterium LB-30]|uniref:Two-component-system connector protein AriR n=1 Tax=Shiella aurantiaca TaxID=3058365 RepID=A0ABT8F862_9BACT|nr:hypothetical protein [Shiella aurantiaca]MDN4166131.1 hypothetical protein [Shiella aurantiaca]
MNQKEMHSDDSPAQIVESILNEFSFYNDHVLRGPLCRIAGLISLLNMEKEEENRKKIIKCLAEAADEIDAASRTLTCLLNKYTTLNQNHSINKTY